MKTIIAVLLYLALLLAGQVIWKKGMTVMPGVFKHSLSSTALSLITSPHVIAGIILFSLATVVWLYLLSKYELSYIYPVTSLSFVLTVGASFIFLGEALVWNRIFGVIVISVGVYLVSIK